MPITIADIPEIVKLGRLAHAESKYSYLPYSETQVSDTFTQHCLNDKSLAVKLYDDRIAGFLIAEIMGLIFTDVPIAMETCYYILPEYRKQVGFKMLIDAFNDWAAGRPQITIPHFAEDNTSTCTALSKFGFKEAGKIMTRGF